MALSNAIEATRTRSAAGRAPRRARIPFTTALRHAIIIFCCLSVIVPIGWVFLMSVKTDPEAYTGVLWPTKFVFTNYPGVFQRLPTVVRNFTNSIVVTFSTVFFTSICAIFAGYALVHLRLPGRVVVLSILVGTLFFPTRLVSLIGIFQIQYKLHLINTLPGLILPYVTLNLALSILIMRSIFEQISTEIVEAARMDGASSWHILWKIMLPLIVNGLVVLLIINFVTAWGEYLLAYTLINDQVMRTMPVVLATAMGGFGEWAWPQIAAVYIIAITPGIVGFAIAQRWYMKGLIEGAVKL
jgi:ABC-type glycerol-3-phosphate transport system permease component